jgi:hypothetical protein
MEFIKEYENVLGINICEIIINKFEKDENKHKGETINGITDDKITYDLHSNEWYGEEWNIIYTLLKDALHTYIIKYYDELGNLFPPYPHTEDSGFQIQKYIKNQGFYKYHNDFYLDSRGFRTLTYIFYLNNIEDGGETEFYNGKKINPKKGMLVIFPSLWTYLHKGNTPISNDKYIITGWIYSRY